MPTHDATVVSTNSDHIILGLSSPIVRIVLAIAAIVCGGAFMTLNVPFPVSREYSRPATCKSNLHNIQIALESYHVEHSHYPPAYTVDENGRRLHSWRTLLLPYFGYHEMYAQIRLDEPWDSPHNRQLSDTIVEAFRCPSDDGEGAFTNYVVVVGPEMIFRGSTPTRKKQIQDGLPETILVVETIDSDIHWIEPRDLDAGTMRFQLHDSPDGIRSHHPGGVNVAYADGQIRFVSDRAEPARLRAMFTIDGGEAVESP